MRNARIINLVTKPSNINNFKDCRKDHSNQDLIIWDEGFLISLIISLEIHVQELCEILSLIDFYLLLLYDCLIHY